MDEDKFQIKAEKTRMNEVLHSTSDSAKEK